MPITVEFHVADLTTLEILIWGRIAKLTFLHIQQSLSKEKLETSKLNLFFFAVKSSYSKKQTNSSVHFLGESTAYQSAYGFI